MENKVKELQKPLEISDIDFRIQSINKGKYVTILAYKDARVDMQRLDDVLGALNWKREHSRDNKNCTVSIWCDVKNQWISKEDTGTESNTEQAKGLASDSFKRSCFNLGIGRELYGYPVISFRLNDDECTLFNGKIKPTFNFKLKEWKWLSQFTDGKITFLACKDTQGKVRFTFGKFTK